MKVVSSIAQRTYASLYQSLSCGWFLRACCCAGLLLALGCGKPGTSRGAGQAPGEVEHLCFSPAKIRVSPLTKLILPTSAGEMARIKVCAVLLDPFESHLKAPGTFRFEVYERVLRSAAPKGTRIRMWDDIDLRSARPNNEYWEEVFQAYEFDLEFDPKKYKSFILEFTFILPENQRLTTDYPL